MISSHMEFEWGSSRTNTTACVCLLFVYLVAYLLCDWQGTFISSISSGVLCCLDGAGCASEGSRFWSKMLGLMAAAEAVNCQNIDRYCAKQRTAGWLHLQSVWLEPYAIQKLGQVSRCEIHLPTYPSCCRGKYMSTLCSVNTSPLNASTRLESAGPQWNTWSYHFHLTIIWTMNIHEVTL